MTDSYDLYELEINGRTVNTPIALASMAGITDADYVLARKDNCGIAFIGGYSTDEPTIAAGKEMEKSGRAEFLSDDPIATIKEEVSKLKDSGVLTGLNLRGCEPQSFINVFNAVGKDVIYEIDAHCRQPAMVGAGAGEYLLKNTEKLAGIIRALKDAGAVVSVKIRAGVSDDDAVLAAVIDDAGADIIHVDLMDFGTAKLKEIRNNCNILIIANNSINDFEAARDMFSHGADIVSLGRHADNATLSGIRAGIEVQAKESGWYNSPKQLCRGGDIRSLAFCCMPVKRCPLIPFLDKIGVTPKEYHDYKVESVAGTKLSPGESTCFGSLAWCCKSSTPCMFRDLSLKREQLSHREYMRSKRRLSEQIMKRIFDARKGIPAVSESDAEE